MAPKVGYRGYGLTYTILYFVILYGECATDESFCMRRPNIFKTTPFFTRRWYAIYRTSLQYVIRMVAQSPYDLYCKHQCNLHWWHPASVTQLAPAKWQWQAGDAEQARSKAALARRTILCNSCPVKCVAVDHHFLQCPVILWHHTLDNYVVPILHMSLHL